MVEVEASLQAAFLNALGAQAALTVEDLSSAITQTLNDDYMNLDHSSVHVYKYGRIVVLDAVLQIDVEITAQTVLASGIPLPLGGAVYFIDGRFQKTFCVYNGVLLAIALEESPIPTQQYPLNLVYLSAS